MLALLSEEKYPYAYSKSHLPYMSRDTYGDKRKRCFHNECMSMASNLRKARQAAGLTQAAVARVFGISREAVALWESEGEKGTKPDIRRLQTLSEIYKVPVSDLLDDDPLYVAETKSGYSPEPAFSRSAERDEKEDAFFSAMLKQDEKEVISIWKKMSANARDRWVKIGGVLLGDDVEKPSKPPGRTVNHPGHSEANSVIKGKIINDLKKEDKK